MRDFRRLTNVNSVRTIQVIEVISIVGAGTKDDPIREIMEYYSPTGRILARHNDTEDLTTGSWLEDDKYTASGIPVDKSSNDVDVDPNPIEETQNGD